MTSPDTSRGRGLPVAKSEGHFLLLVLETFRFQNSVLLRSAMQIVGSYQFLSVLSSQWPSPQKASPRGRPRVSNDSPALPRQSPDFLECARKYLESARDYAESARYYMVRATDSPEISGDIHGERLTLNTTVSKEVLKSSQCYEIKRNIMQQVEQNTKQQVLQLKLKTWYYDAMTVTITKTWSSKQVKSDNTRLVMKPCDRGASKHSCNLH